MITPKGLKVLVSCIASILVLLLSCAEPQAPQGGPADKQPPRISTKQYSTPNPSTNFRDNQIILTFDEWIKLQGAFNQVVISPPLNENPEIKIRNKSVVVTWNEKLKDSTTYTINFGDAVRDITENNIVPNLRMVFSTGPFLDSLMCRGQIVEAATRKPKEGTLVMLYKNLQDSVPLTERPYYFSRTDDQGNFKIENISTGYYKIFALEDKNSNYKYDLPNEEIAFLDSAFQITDSLQPALRLTMFKEREKTKVFTSKLVHYGCLTLIYNNELHSPSTVELVDAPSNYKSAIEQGLDTLTLWFDGTMPKTDKWIFVVKNEREGLLDTVRVSAIEKQDFEENTQSLRWYIPQEKTTSNSGKKGGGPIYIQPPLQDTTRILQNPFQNLNLFFTRSIENWNKTKFLLEKDSVVSVERWQFAEKVDSINQDIIIDSVLVMVDVDTFFEVDFFEINQDITTKTKISIESNWKENARYRLTLLPDAITDLMGYNNTDTLLRVYMMDSTSSYGTITAIVTNADSLMQYVVQLVNGKEQVVQEHIFKDSTQITQTYPNLKTDNYTLRIIHDAYANGRWDVGNYKEKRQAEKTTTSKVMALKPGWENTMEVDLEATNTSSGKTRK